MLYVFYVDIGSMLKFDISLAAQSIHKLQEAIARYHHIHVSKQVLLISGGENVTASNKVSSYFAGTDSNPFFLFNKDALESHFPSFELPPNPSDKILEEQLKEYLDKPPTLEVVATRAKIVQNFCDAARKKLDICSELVHSQHLQHQGWAAVIANLLDITSAFKVRVNLFLQNLNEYLEDYDKNVSLVSSFSQVLTLLGKIPLLSCLPVAITSSKDVQINSLLDWINAHDVRGSLDDLIQQCKEGLEQYGEVMREEHLLELKKVEDAIFVDKNEMKIIKGLEDRLSGLEKLMINVKKIVKEQEDMAKIFSNFHLKIRSLQDQSSIADLCGSHKQYLEITLSNHHCLLQNTFKCYKTKHELCANLNNRLRWVMLTEQSLCKTDNQVLLKCETLKKLRQKLEVVQQIYTSPQVFCKSIMEVHRRREFTKCFLMQAARTSLTFNESHSKEVNRRKEFERETKIHEFVHRWVLHREEPPALGDDLCIAAIAQVHFLRSLFPGLEDLPSPYATKCPDDFDRNLPEVTSEDISFLQRKVPELAKDLKLENFQEENYVDLSKQTQTDYFEIPDEGNACFQDRPVSTTSSHDVPFSHAGMESTFFEFDQVHDATSKVDVSTLTSPPVHRHVTSLSKKLPAISPNSRAIVAMHRPSPSADGFSPVGGKSKRSHLQSSSTSPDCEDAHSFATADFYFDESLQSSSGTTDPASSKKISELQLLLQERVVQLEAKDKELNESKEMVQNFSEKISSLNKNYCELVQFCTECIFETKTFLTDVKAEHSCFIEVIMSHLQMNKSSFGKLAEDILLLLTSNEETLNQNKIELDETKGKLSIASDQVEYLTKIVEELETSLADKVTTYEEIIETANSVKVELQEKINQMLLETEIEVDKMRSDFMTELLNKDDEISSLRDQLKTALGEVKAAVYDKELSMETLNQQFETEKINLKESLNNEFIEKQTERDVILRSEVQEECERIRVDHLSAVELENKKKLDCIGSEIDKLASNLSFLKEEMVLSEYKDSVKSDSVEFLPSDAIFHIEDDIFKKFRLISDLTKCLRNSLCTFRQDYHALNLKLEESEKRKTELEKDFSELQLKLIESLDDIKSQTNQSIEESSTSFSRTEDNKMERSLQTSSEYLLIDDHQKVLDDKISVISSEHREEITKLQTEHNEHCTRLVEEMSRKYEEEKRELRDVIRSAAEAERQILFNKALNQALHERDEQIDVLEATVASLRAELLLKNENKVPVEKKKIVQSTSGGELSSAAEKLPTSELMQATTLEQSFVVQSNPLASDPDILEKMNILEMAIKNKDQENKKLKDKLMQLSMTKSSQTLYQDFVNIRTCSEGSITLFVWDQHCSHYVAYLVNNSCKYFLHSESLEALGIKLDSSTCSTPWIVAEVINKECCQAKKPSNRFKVPVGTKFYRVRVKPWNPEVDQPPRNKKTRSDV